MQLTINFQYEHPKNDDDLVWYDVTADIDYSVDSDYGADADGNRGTAQAQLEEITITSVIDIDDNQITFDDLDEAIRDGMTEHARTSFYER